MRISKWVVYATAAAASAIVSFGSALAADMTARYTKAPAAVIDPAYDWTGFYVGVNGGYGWQDRRPDLALQNTAVGSVAVPTAGLSASGGFGGAQAGYNWQRGQFVFGLETDIQGASITDGFFRTVDAGGDVVNASRRIDYFGTVRGRLGLAANNWLFYVTGGFAYAGLRSNVVVTNPGAPGVSATLNSNNVQSGYAVGAGVEYAIGKSWSVKGEYQYIGLGGYTLSAPLVPVTGISVFSNRLQNDFHTVRIGLNYKFGGPVVAKY